MYLIRMGQDARYGRLMRYRKNRDYLVPNPVFKSLYSTGRVSLWHYKGPYEHEYDRIESGQCYVVASGPSLHGYNFKKLRRKNVIVCGRGWESIPWAKYLVAIDADVFLVGADHIPDLNGYKGTVFTRRGYGQIHRSAIEIDQRPRVYGVADSLNETIPAINTGMAAINIAYCLGFNPIYILGYDCAISYDIHPDGQPHYYDDGPWRRALIHGKGNYGPALLEKWRKTLDWQAAHYRYKGVEVINLGPLHTLKNYKTE